MVYQHNLCYTENAAHASLQRPGTAKVHNETKNYYYNQPKRPSIRTIHRPSTGHHRKSSQLVT